MTKRTQSDAVIESFHSTQAYIYSNKTKEVWYSNEYLVDRWQHSKVNKIFCFTPFPHQFPEMALS